LINLVYIFTNIIVVNKYKKELNGQVACTLRCELHETF
jgi:hypothetical protein